MKELKYILVLLTLVSGCTSLDDRNPDSSNRRTLIIGDSLSSGTRFGLKMADFFERPQSYCKNVKDTYQATNSYARPSSATRHWIATSGTNKNWLCKQKTIYVNGTSSRNTSGAALCGAAKGTSVFASLVKKHKANAYFIALGTNSLGMGKASVQNRIKELLAQVPKGSLCFWTPTTLTSSKYIKKARNVEAWTRQALSESSRSCYLIPTIDSVTKRKSCSKFYVGDGIHHTKCGSDLWAQTVIDKICGLNVL
jgi:lysophospholipase L1-like esterase